MPLDNCPDILFDCYISTGQSMPLPWDYFIGLFSRQLNLWEYVVDLWQNRLRGVPTSSPHPHG